MSSVNPDVDLGALRRGESHARRRRRLGLPLAIALVAGFLVLLAWSLFDTLRGGVRVTVVRPQAVAGEGAAGGAAGGTLFQAAGWVEPDPFPLQVTAQAPGVVEAILVQESQTVAAGEPVARLIDKDARLALGRAEAALQQAVAEAERAETEDALARQAFEQALAVTEADLTAKAELAAREAGVQQARAQLEVAQGELLLQRWLQENHAAGPRQVELAQAREQQAQAELKLATAQRDAASARAARAASERALRLEDRQKVAAASAAKQVALARQRDAELARDEAKLRLERMTIQAPAAGVVLQRLAVPGMPLAELAPVCTLFDPGSLRVRVDVPQSEVRKAFPGQLAALTTEARLGHVYRGELLRVVSQADIQKVTLQVHVRVLDPDRWLRPEMLCQVRFLAGGGAGSQPSGSAPYSALLAVPQALVEGDAVWIVTADGTASRRAVQVVRREGGVATIGSGINLSDKVIDHGRQGLREGQRVEVVLHH
jgi:RND family efflux transporter MFP subunit